MRAETKVQSESLGVNGLWNKVFFSPRGTHYKATVYYFSMIRSKSLWQPVLTRGGDFSKHETFIRGPQRCCLHLKTYQGERKQKKENFSFVCTCLHDANSHKENRQPPQASTTLHYCVFFQHNNIREMAIFNTNALKKTTTMKAGLRFSNETTINHNFGREISETFFNDIGMRMNVLASVRRQKTTTTKKNTLTVEQSHRPHLMITVWHHQRRAQNASAKASWVIQKSV